MEKVFHLGLDLYAWNSDQARDGLRHRMVRHRMVPDHPGRLFEENGLPNRQAHKVQLLPQPDLCSIDPADIIWHTVEGCVEGVHCPILADAGGGWPCEMLCA